MSKFQYTLEKYKGQKSRFTCPECLHKKEFSRYINVDTNEYLNDKVGSCNRANKCDYHYKPKQYFEDNKSLVPPTRTFKPKYEPPKPTSYIDRSILLKSLNHYENNNFVQFLELKFGKEITNQTIRNYKIGTSKRWNGATVFWQVDKRYKVRSGKIMLYNGSNRVKNCNSWAHSVMQLKDFNLKQCFYGEHLINTNNSTIAIVESEKTAIIGSIYFPQFLWLASSGSGGVNIDKLKALKDRTIILFPDASINGKMFLKWEEKTKHLENVSVNNFLEVNTNLEEKTKGVDLADFLLKYSLKEFRENRITKFKSKKDLILEEMNVKNPIVNQLIEKLNLNIE